MAASVRVGDESGLRGTTPVDSAGPSEAPRLAPLAQGTIRFAAWSKTMSEPVERASRMVDLAGIEPATSRTPSGRSPPELQARGRYPLNARHVRGRSTYRQVPSSLLSVETAPERVRRTPWHRFPLQPRLAWPAGQPTTSGHRRTDLCHYSHRSIIPSTCHARRTGHGAAQAAAD